MSEHPVFESGAMRDRWDSHAGSIYRMVTSFAEDGTPEALFTFPRGQSEDPESEHFDDLTSAWQEGAYQPIPFRDSEVETHTVSSYVLSR